MKLRSGTDDGTIILELSEDEADKVLDPFDPNDKEMPSHLYHQRHRYCKEEFFNWMVANIGRPSWDWHIQNIGGTVWITLRNPQHATIVKLAWAGS